MKFGMRKPSIKKRIKAKTTGKLKKQVNKTINPLYGKKGMGFINNPKKSIYNKVYDKTTVGILPKHKRAKKSTHTNVEYPIDFDKISYMLLKFIIPLLIILIIPLCLIYPILLIIEVLLIGAEKKVIKKLKQYTNYQND